MCFARNGRHSCRGLALFVGLAISCLVPRFTYATLAVPVQSASGAVTAGAGVEASARDASTAFYNPAAMALLRERQAVAALGLIFPHSDFRDGRGTDATGGALSGSSDTVDRLQVVPSL